MVVFPIPTKWTFQMSGGLDSIVIIIYIQTSGSFFREDYHWLVSPYNTVKVRMRSQRIIVIEILLQTQLYIHSPKFCILYIFFIPLGLTIVTY